MISKKTKKKNNILKTYLIKSNCIDKKTIKKNFDKNYWIPYNSKNKNKNKNIEFMFVDTKYTFDKSLYNIKADIKNMIDLSSDNFSVTNKSNLFMNLFKLKNKKVNKYLPQQKFINLYNIYKKKDKLENYKFFFNNKVIIFKYVYSLGGKNIFIFKDYLNFEENIKKIINKNKKIWSVLDYNEYLKYNKKKEKYNIEWVIQEYITNPFLIEGKKNHFRSYLLFDKNKKTGYYLNKSIIATSNKKYKNDDYYNKDIHDTHFYRTDKQINFPDNFNNILKKNDIINIHKQIIEIFSFILDIFKDNVKCFKENKKCFHLFGCDLLLTDNLQIKLLEFNGNPACSADIFKKGKYNYPQIIFELIIKKIIDKKNKNQNKNNNNNKLNERLNIKKLLFIELES
jgi:glutathione synthase/RimK-type ligase-like ATP-grasp enzyme